MIIKGGVPVDIKKIILKENQEPIIMDGIFL
jgi:hypothetical protein